MQDTEFVLYHYPASPYAEKVRLLAGYLDLAWRSIEVPIQPPRDILALMAGGYRRIPVAQIGADVFCDTAIITEELLARSLTTLAACDDEATALATRAENAVFFSAIRQNSQLKTALGLMLKLGLRGMLAFAKDRASFAVDFTPAQQTPAQARAIFTAFVCDLDRRLDSAPYVGGEAPCMSDFRCYHPLFLAKAFRSVKASQLPTAVSSWMIRMEAFGWGRVSAMTEVDVVALTKSASPRALKDSATCHADVGDWVTVTPLDTGRVPVTGTLAGQDATRITIARRSDDVGLVHVHFPSNGFDCQKIQ